MLITAALLMAFASPAPQAAVPTVFEKVRSDGVRVVCVEHVKRPSIVSPRTECRTPQSWRNAAIEREYFPSVDNFYPNPAYATVPQPSKPVLLR